MDETHHMENLFSAGRKKFAYKCGTCFRGNNPTSLDRNISEVGGDFETNEYRKVKRTIDIREEEIIISGWEMFIESITPGIREEFEAGSYEDNDAVFTGWKSKRRGTKFPM